MLIILEGPDGSGKSTLARKLQRVLETREQPVTLLHAGPPKDHPLTEYEIPLVTYHPGQKQHIICDRWHVGEMVYPEVLSRPTQWDGAVQRHITSFLASRGALIVTLEPSLEMLRERVTERGDDMVKVDQLAKIVVGFRHAMLGTRMLPTYRYRREVTDDDVELIIQMARTAERLTTELAPFTTYVGPSVPRLLILGDVRHNPPHYAASAFMPYPATSGHFLLHYLDVVNQHVGVANACDVDNPRDLWLALRKPLVVALGNKANRSLNELGVPHVSAPHPQYVRRFHHSHGQTYADVILEAGLTERNALSWRP